MTTVHNHPLAIVVPAYRGRFLSEALESMARQTVQTFTVYVGDDASPDDLQTIVEHWRGKLDIRYRRFECNLGGQDLAGQWQRCIAMTGHEPWIWVFGDDDCMDAECVERLLPLLYSPGQRQVLRFAVTQIDAAGHTTLVENAFPAHVSAREFIFGKLQGHYQSHAPEFVFARCAYRAETTFQSFPLAWCTDDAAWLSLAAEGGITTVAGPHVHWRVSDQNISSAKPELRMSKVIATSLFLDWLVTHLQTHAALPDEPQDEQILLAARHWFYSHARGLGYRFGWWPDAQLLRNLKRLPGHGTFRTRLRMMDSDRHAKRMSQIDR